MPQPSPRARRQALLLLAAAALAVWVFGCSDDIPTDLGGDLRVPPDSLQLIELRGIAIDTVFSAPVSMGRATSGQVGQRFPYTAHVLYDFRIATRVLDGADTLRLDSATLVIKSDSILSRPFTGNMRLGLFEVDSTGRDWANDTFLDSALVQLPPLEPDSIASDIVVNGDGTVNTRVSLSFEIDLTRIAGYDSVRAAGGELDVNVAMRFEGFTPSGSGFLPLRFEDQLIGFSNDRENAIATVNPRRRRVVAELDPTFTPGTNLVVSDGFRLHSFVKFDSVRSVLPDSALVFLAEFVLTVVDTTDGRSFDDVSDERLGVVVPRDTLVFGRPVNNQPASFTAPVVPAPLSTVTVTVTPYFFDQQEGNIANRGMVLVLPNEGTRIRHYEFYGAGALQLERRPFIRIVYGFPAPFEEDGP